MTDDTAADETATDPELRSITLERTAFARFRATNRNGETIEIGEGDGAFTPVELLLAAIAACGAIDVDYIVSKRDQPRSFAVRAQGRRVKDEGGNHIEDIVVGFDPRFADTEAGAKALEVLPRAMAQSHDRLCWVTRTVVLGADVTFTTSR